MLSFREKSICFGKIPTQYLGTRTWPIHGLNKQCHVHWYNHNCVVYFLVTVKYELQVLRQWTRLMLKEETGERKKSGCYILQDTKCWKRRLPKKAVHQTKVLYKQNCITSLETLSRVELKKQILFMTNYNL